MVISLANTHTLFIYAYPIHLCVLTDRPSVQKQQRFLSVKHTKPYTELRRRGGSCETRAIFVVFSTIFRCFNRVRVGRLVVNGKYLRARAPFSLIPFRANGGDFTRNIVERTFFGPVGARRKFSGRPFLPIERGKVQGTSKTPISRLPNTNSFIYTCVFRIFNSTRTA